MVAPPTDMIRADYSSTQVIDSLHMDYIHQVAFSKYGRRLATSSGDRFVRVFDLTETGDWALTATWQAHRGAVTSIGWAHPEFGSLLATAGSDHDAKLWEEGSLSSSLTSRWTCKASLTEARRAATCLEFAPRHWGLKLAVGSADGSVRIYEAVDIMNLAQWPLAATLQSFAEGSTKLGCTCLSWCNGRFEPPTLVVGGSHLVIYRYSEAARAWQPLMQLPPPEKGVLDVSWAPNVGRRFHYIASAENQQLRVYKLLRQSGRADDASQRKNNTNEANHSTTSTDNNTDSHSTSTNTTTSKHLLVLESTQTLVTNAWRCEWNVTGTVLASSGDVGVVHLWKNTADGQFVQVAKVQGDLSHVSAAAAASK